MMVSQGSWIRYIFCSLPEPLKELHIGAEVLQLGGYDAAVLVSRCSIRTGLVADNWITMLISSH